tara:strand:- start:782 stop:2146 length:1365 start_codon:yes stop_codon:yes gene_type:complete
MSKLKTVEDTNTIDFNKLFNFIVKYFWFFVASFIVSFILATTYKIFNPDVKQYSSKITILSPSFSTNSKIEHINDMIVLRNYNFVTDGDNVMQQEPLQRGQLADSNSVFKNFINTVNSPNFQKSVFDNENFYSQLNPNKVLSGDTLSSFNSFRGSFKLAQSNLGSDSLKKNIDFEIPIIFSINGPNPKTQERFLNALISQASQMVVDDFYRDNRLIINNHISVLNQQKDFLVNSTNVDRLASIQKMTDDDNEKIRALLDEIKRFNSKEDKLRSTRIEVLKQALFIAKKLGIEKNNFNSISLNSPSFSNLVVLDSKDYPTWYLFGSEALEMELEILNSKNKIVSKNVIDLEDEISSIQSNQRLTTLLKRKSDESYTLGASELANKIFYLEKLSLSIGKDQNISPMQVIRTATSNKMGGSSLYKKYFALLSALAGFFLSVLIALILNIFAIVKKSK